MVSASAPIPASPIRRRPAHSARSNGTARPAPISWSTAPRTCSSWSCRIRRRGGCMSSPRSRRSFTTRSKNDRNAMMLQQTVSGDQTAAAPTRIVAFDRARTFITLLVVLHHSVVNYTHFGDGDKARWLGFDLIVLFNDSFFMACMFLISGLFVHQSLTNRGPSNFLANRAFRLGIPYLVSIFVLMPIAYYPTFLRYHMPGTTDFNFFHFWWRVFTVGPWPSGPAWFIWVLLAFDAVAALVWSIAPGAIRGLGWATYRLRYRPGFAFVGFLLFSCIVYLPMRLWVGDAA